MNTKLLFIIGAVLIMGGILFPLFNYLRSARKEKNKVGKGLKNSTIVDDSQPSSESNVVGYVNPEKNIEYVDSRILLDWDSIVPCNEDMALLKINDVEYLGYLEVGGVPFNLLSAEEKFSLEEMYGNVLNGIDYPIQQYIQSRTMNLDEHNNRYRDNVNRLEKKLNAIEKSLDMAKREEEIKILSEKKRKLENQVRYGKQLLNYFSKRFIEFTLLEGRYFIILRYYHDESQFEDFTDYDILESAFNDIVNRGTLFIDNFTRKKMKCKFLNGIEIAELLFNSFNKEDGSSTRIENMLKKNYNHLCTTSKPLHVKRMEHEMKNVAKEQEALREIIKEELETMDNGGESNV